MAEPLGERGYAATSPREVMTRAQVGQGSMYHHFSGKHELAVEALSGVIKDSTREASLLAGEGSPLERMKRHLSIPRPGRRGCRVRRMTQDPRVVTDAELIAIVASAFDTMVNRWEQTITEAVDAGELPTSIRPADLARTVAVVIQGGYALARAQGAQGPNGRSDPGSPLLARRRSRLRQRRSPRSLTNPRRSNP